MALVTGQCLYVIWEPALVLTAFGQIGGFRQLLPNQNSYQFEALFTIAQVLDLGLLEDGIFRYYFADPAIADMFGLHVLLFLSV